jgi:perosamine synthetase
MPVGELAMLGGPRAVEIGEAQREMVSWPIVTDSERSAVLAVLDHGGYTSIGSGSRAVQQLERDWAAYTGTAHCAAVANGTAAIELAVTAVGIDAGAEILVPALSFIATAAAPARLGVQPVFVDIDPLTFNLNPAAAAAAVTPRTQAILAVHLHGLPADMAELRDVADRHGLALIEDAAQAHAAEYRGKRAGALGDIAAFSLNVSKNLPTCGEGGLVTTDDPAAHDRVVLHRQFGERISGPGPRRYDHEVLAGNAKLSVIQAVFAHSQLGMLSARAAGRDHNVRFLLKQVGGLDGLLLPGCPADRSHAWHMLRFRVDPAAMGYPDVSPGAMRAIVQRALRAEGVPAMRYQSRALPAQPALQAAGFSGYRADQHPVTAAVIEDSFTLQRWHLNPAAMPVLERCADAFHKVWEHRDSLAAIVRRRT